ncbi:MAG TPA: TIGR02680 family protein [Streptosporangiaceae bacterium]
MSQQRPPRRFDERWRLSRAGIVNVWHYLDNEFDLSGGRMILRGTNGSGKSRALEMLLPFLLDADRRRMDATGAARVSLDELMRTGAQGQANRIGYLWLELRRPGGYLTVGALIRHSQSASSTKVWYFTTPLRVGDGLELLSATREPLSRDALTELIGAERLTESPGVHRERVRAEVFGLGGDAGRDRYDGLLQLMHTLRAPDVGNRIDEGRLPHILLESLPPLHDEALTRAGEQLDGLTETRAPQERLENSAGQVATFLAVYQRYAAQTLRSMAGEALAAAGTLAEAEATAGQRAAKVVQLEEESGRLQSQAQQLAEELAEIERALTAIQSREIFKTADDLVQRDNAETALAAAADQALAGAERGRANHQRAVDDAERALCETRDTAKDVAAALAAAREALADAHLPMGGLPAEVRTIERKTTASALALARRSRHRDPDPVTRPAATLADIIPGDLGDAQQTATVAATSAAERCSLAARKLAEARRLAEAKQIVLRVEGEAEQLRSAAEQDASTAEEMAADRDTAAIALAQAWRTWTGGAQTREFFGEIDWSAHWAVGPLIIDAEALTGDTRDGHGDGSLAGLDEAASETARPARAAVEIEGAQLDLEEKAARVRDKELRSERADLAAARDLKPDDPLWLALDREGEPLWRCVEFTGHLTAADQAGLEGALLSAGLLSAVIQPDGAVVAADGELLLSPPGPARPASPRPGRPLSSALRADPAAELPADTIAAVLDSIGFDDPVATTTVSADGTWRNGPLRGRHVTDRARHIGAAARAAHRRERIAQIDAELAELAGKAEQRARRRDELAALISRIDALVRTAPRTADLHAARRVAAEALARAGRSATRAQQEAERARQLRTSWAAELSTHQATCAHLGLPAETGALEVTVTAARRAQDRSDQLSREFGRLAERIRRYGEQLQRASDSADERDAAEQEAEQRWSQWHAFASELAAQHEAVDLSLEQARTELAQTKTAQSRAQREHRTAEKASADLGPLLGTARTLSEKAGDDIRYQTAQMTAAAQRLNWALALPGLVAATTAEALPAIVHPEQITDVRSAARAIQSTVPAPRQPPSLTTVFNAFREFDREVSGQLDVQHNMDDNVFLVEVAGAGDDRTLAGAARALAARVEAGRAALSERERAVFTRFILGGVAEELRRRVNQADQLIDAMNASLRAIRTSNGIGVRLSWRLRDDHAALGRILELVATSDAVRSETQNAELTNLLRQRVEQFYGADPSSGYATHLAAALDYRQWHEVAVTILGPEEGQQRRLSRRAKLSQGETRFVSYVTLFAAADGYLTSLGDDGRALRLILLDDAFAKVDDGTVAELMGLLVSLDLDFVMTGHALWGCFPEVPQLDVYEVRRSDGSSAVTTHVHWDGRNRHLRSTA